MSAPQTIVLLRGLTREAAHWGEFPRLLLRQWPAATVLTPDLAGCGTQWRQPSPASIGGIVADLRERLMAQGVPGPQKPLHLVALSLGGMVAVDWARAWPHELAGVALVNTSLRGFSRWHERLRLANYPALCRVALAGRSAMWREAAVLRLTSAWPERHEAVLRDWAAVSAARPVSASNACRQLWAAARYRAPATAPQVPMQVLTSAGDRLVDPACSRRLAVAWGLPIAEHPQAGHDLPLDDGPWVVAQLARAWGPAGPA